jgi:hypothetical protein
MGRPAGQRVYSNYPDQTVVPDELLSKVADCLERDIGALKDISETCRVWNDFDTGFYIDRNDTTILRSFDLRDRLLDTFSRLIGGQARNPFRGYANSLCPKSDDYVRLTVVDAHSTQAKARGGHKLELHITRAAIPTFCRLRPEYNLLQLSLGERRSDT